MAEPIRADRVKAEKVDWLWRDRVPRRMMTIFGGRPDQGKGLIMALIAAEVSQMKFRNEDGNLRYGRVLYSAIEDSYGLMTAPRLRAAGARMDQIQLWRFQIPLMFKELEARMRNETFDLLVIDPFAAHLSGGVSRHSDNIRQVLTPLTELIEETGTAVAIVEHVLKRVGPNSYPLQAIGGSGSGLPAASRMAFIFGTDPSDEDRRILAPVKHNIREEPKSVAFEVDSVEVEGVGYVPTLLYVDEIEFDPMRLLVIDKKNQSVGRPPDKRAAAGEWLSNYLHAKGGPVRVKIIEEDAKHMAMAGKTLRRAAKDLGVIKDPVGGGPRVTWELPDELKARLARGGSDEVLLAEDLTTGLDEGLAQLLGGEDGDKDDEEQQGGV